MDSINDNLKKKYNKQLIELPAQDENDLRKAIEWVGGKGVKEAVILGATGKREDHILANIFTLLQYPSQLAMTIYNDYGIFSVVQIEQKFDSFIGQKISLFATDPNIEVTSNNLKYNMIYTKLTNLYYGSLNESINDNFSITLSHGRILVYQVFA